MAFFGLKLGLDLEMRVAHPHQKFQGVSPGDFPLSELKEVRYLKKDAAIHNIHPDRLQSVA